MKAKNKLKKAFTLIELVVVIAVIAILAGVSVAAYFGVTESANESNALSEKTQIKDMYTQWYIFNSDEIKQTTDMTGKELVKYQVDGYIPNPKWDIDVGSGTNSLASLNTNASDADEGDINLGEEDKTLSFFAYLQNNGVDLNKINYTFLVDETNEENKFVLFVIRSGDRYSSFITPYSDNNGLYSTIEDFAEVPNHKGSLNTKDDLNTIISEYNKLDEKNLVVDNEIADSSDNNGLEFETNEDGSFDVVNDEQKVNETIEVNFSLTENGDVTYKIREGKNIEFLNPQKRYTSEDFVDNEIEFLGYSVNGSEKLYTKDDFPLKVNDFVDSETKKVTFTPRYEEDKGLEAIVVHNNTSYQFRSLIKAIEFANSKTEEVLVTTQNKTDYVIDENITINENVTLLVSHCDEASNGSSVTDFIKTKDGFKWKDSKKPTEPGFYAVDGGIVTNDVLFSKVTLSEGCELTIKGRLVINSFSDNYRLERYAEFVNNGVINVENDGKIDVHGKLTGTGSTYAKDGSTVLEKMYISSWSSISTNLQYYYANIFPFNKFYFTNIQSKIYIYEGADYQMIGRIYSSSASTIFPFSVSLINKTNAVFSIEEGYVIKSSDGNEQSIDVYGNIKDSDFKFELKVADVYTFTVTPSINLPLYKFNINLHNDSEITLNNKYEFMPGSTLNTYDNSVLNINNLVMFVDKVEGKMPISSTKEAKLTINNDSTINVNGSILGGKIYFDSENNLDNIHINEGANLNPKFTYATDVASLGFFDKIKLALGTYKKPATTKDKDLPATFYINDVEYVYNNGEFIKK